MRGCGGVEVSLLLVPLLILEPVIEIVSSQQVESRMTTTTLATTRTKETAPEKLLGDTSFLVAQCQWNAAAVIPTEVASLLSSKKKEKYVETNLFYYNKMEKQKRKN